MDLEKLRNTEYKKCVDLLAELIDLDTDLKAKILKSFQGMGIKSFFLKIESVGLSLETAEKLKSIKAIIDIFDFKRGLE